LYFSFYAVHTPIQGKEALVEKYESKEAPYEMFDPTYAAMLETLDQNVGRLLGSLGELDLAKNTIVVFYSDNGPYFPVSTAKPLRGSKGMLYEGGALGCRWR